MTSRISTRLLSAATAVALGVTLAACGGSDEETVTLGFIAPLKGSNSATAEMMVNAAELAVSQANEDGGIDGKKVELKVYDDELSPDVASRVATRAITVDEVSVLVGGLSSAEGLAIREVAERNKVPYLASASSAAGVTDGATYTFRVAATADAQARAITDIAAALDAKTVGILYDNGAVGSAYADVFQERAGEIGLEIAGKPIEYTLGATDVSGPIQAIAKAKPDAILIGGSTGADHGLIAKTLVEQGVDAPIMGTVAVGFPDAFVVGGDSYDKLPGAYFPASVDISSPSFKEFEAAYAEAYGAEEQYPDAAVQSYDATRLAILALQDSDGEGGASLKDALKGLDGLSGGAGKAGTTITFKEGQDGFPEGALVFYQAKDGTNEQAVDLN